jgi:K+-sensing histidine kinase KdpD
MTDRIKELEAQLASATAGGECDASPREKIDIMHELFECHQALVEAYKQAGDFEKALAHYEQFHVIKEEVFNEEAVQRLKSLEAMHQVETARQEAEIDRLKNIEFEREITERTQALLAEIAERERAEMKLRQSYEELVTLNAITTVISHSRNLRYILEATLDMVLSIVGPAACYVQLVDETEGTLSMVAQSGFPQETVEELKAIQLRDTQYESGQSRVLPGAPADVLREAIRRTGWHSSASVPLRFKNAILGHLEVFSREARELDLHQLQLLKTIGRQVGVAIQNERLIKDAAETKALQELDRLRSELVSNVSHELRTPLGLIKAASTTLLAEDVEFDRQTQRTLLQGIDEETDRLEHIVSNLLDLSRMEQRRLILDRSPTDIGLLTRSVIEAMQIQTTPCQFVLDLPPQPLLANVDANRIEQVLRNLLSNALKYSPEGGLITVNVGQDESQLLISVSDQGIGIPPADLDNVFERFYRVENETTRQVSGAGLGLAISRGIVEAHGGRIWVKSDLGVGSTFYFSLPLS